MLRRKKVTTVFTLKAGTHCFYLVGMLDRRQIREGMKSVWGQDLCRMKNTLVKYSIITQRLLPRYFFMPTTEAEYFTLAITTRNLLIL